MKKIIIIIFFLGIILNANIVYADETEDTIKEQEEILGIAGFIKEAEKYSKESFEDMDINSLYKNAISRRNKCRRFVGRNIKNSWNRSLKNFNKSWIYINNHNNT